MDPQSKSAPGSRRISTQTYPDSEEEGGKAFSALAPGQNHPDAESSTSGGSLSFPGTPDDRDRSIQKGEQLLTLEAPPWEGHVEDSRGRYPLPLFPGTYDPVTLEVVWTGNEEEDFKRSFKYWEKETEAKAEEKWQQRKQRKVSYWLRWHAARGAYLVLNENSAARLMDQAQEEREGLELFCGDRSLLPGTAAFTSLRHSKDWSESSESISIIIGGGIGAPRKTEARTEEVGVSDRSTAGASRRPGGQQNR